MKPIIPFPMSNLQQTSGAIGGDNVVQDVREAADNTTTMKEQDPRLNDLTVPSNLNPTNNQSSIFSLISSGFHIMTGYVSYLIPDMPYRYYFEPVSNDHINEPNNHTIDTSKDNHLQITLSGLGLTQAHKDYILDQGVKFLEKPHILSMKLDISLETAKNALEALNSCIQEPVNQIQISEANIISIENCLKEHPEFDTNDLSLLCEIDEAIVSAYFETKPLSDAQKAAITERFNAGCTVTDIVHILKLSNRKVQEYVESTFLTFTGEEAKKILNIILNNFREIKVSKLREMVICRNLKLQDQLCCILHQRNETEYRAVEMYFSKFVESQTFFQIDRKLTIEDILLIKQHNFDSREQLSIKLNKVETVIHNFLMQYCPNTVEREYFANMQVENINVIVNTFGQDTLSFHAYRMIISDSFENIIESAKRNRQDPRAVFRELLPLSFYYLKCSLSLQDITQIIAHLCEITLTTHDLFHLLFQLSDPVLRGFCIEHYSFSNPVPFYYPILQIPYSNRRESKFEICKELWYSLQTFNGLISFGLGRAGWNPIGKSHLLDLIFGTDFEKGNPSNSSFHLNAIDIQMTKNLFGETKDESSIDSTKWAYIDCHSHSNLDIIRVLCRHLDIALVHVTYSDYTNNFALFNKEVDSFVRSVEHLYLLIRDYDGHKVEVESKMVNNRLEKHIFIPNLSDKDRKIHSITTSLKEIGYGILKTERPKLIGSDFLENVLGELDCPSMVNIQSDKALVQKMTAYIDSAVKFSGQIDFSFLNYYPLFVDYMSCYYQAFYQTDQGSIDKLNAQCGSIAEILLNTEMGEFVLQFNEILSRKNSTMILWKLSQELTILSKQLLPKNTVDTHSVIEQKTNKYNLEIIWRETLLSLKYEKMSKKYISNFQRTIGSNFSNHVERGEAFELIDGDNLRYLNKDIDELLFSLYDRQFKELDEINKGKNVRIKQAPIVVSIFGPQSSGKSTLLNYCFGCKFLTSAGRCTRGVYGSLSRLSRPVNLTDHFLILDTEGLDAIERGNIKDTSMIHFDRTMVLFCLSVSQVVIINVKGDIGCEMQNLLQICAYSLNKLKVRKVAAPKIFFVLNQQADPDPAKHLDSITILMDKLNKESDLMDTEGIKISDLIQVSRHNLFILPSAFNSEQMNKPGSKLFDSKVIKLSPTITFADKCADLRLAIIEQLDCMPIDDRAPFNTLSEWMDMSGTIWDTIIKYQDIVKYRNVEELMCSNLLRTLVSELMKNNINSNKEKFKEITDKLLLEINQIDTLFDFNSKLAETMVQFDEEYNKHQNECLIEFSNKCSSDTRLKKLNHICDEHKTNLSRLIYIERKNHEDKLKFHIKAVLTEIKLSESMKKFQEAIIRNVDNYLELSVENQKLAFEKTWAECFGDDDPREEETERDENFNNLYSIFKMESRSMENRSTIYELFRKFNFILDDIINFIRSELFSKFQSDPQFIKGNDQFIYVCNENSGPIKHMTPYVGNTNYEHFGKDSLFVVSRIMRAYWYPKDKLNFSNWVPKECHPLVRYCSGYINHPDITWDELDKNNQILLLASLLRAPDDNTLSTWDKFVKNISTKVQEFIARDPNISQGTVREIANYLCSLYTLVNYEIGFIQAKLSNTAERNISIFVFAYAFKSLLELKMEKRLENRSKKEIKKASLLMYFLQKIETRKMVRGTLYRDKMKESDRKIAIQFAQDLLGGIQRGVNTEQLPIIENRLREQKIHLSHESILLSADDTITKELCSLDSNPETLDVNSFVIQYVCDRNKLIWNIFQKRWTQIEDERYIIFADEIKDKFTKQVRTIVNVLEKLLANLTERCSENRSYEQKAFDSDSNFDLVEIGTSKEISSEQLIKRRESPFKAMLTYLRMYLDPTVSPEEFNTFFNNIFMVDGVKIKPSDTYILCKKRIDPMNVLDEAIFKKLSNTKMFNSESIFNISEFITHFLSVLTDYKYELTKAEFAEMIKPIKEEFEKDVIGCPSHCPSCGKLCERELHPNDGNCQIKTGHQICSMGGKVWNNDKDRTAVLFMCDDYTDNTRVIIPGQTMNWGEFKEKCGNKWDWTLHKDEKYFAKQQNNSDKMKNIWNKFGRGILKYYLDTFGTEIKYIPYTSVDDVYKTQFSVKYNICFVIDGTGSMHREIERARISVGQLISKYKERGTGSKFKVVIYRDHCDKNIIEMFPNNNKFTPQHETIQTFLKGVKADGGGDVPEAVLDGLATAATQCEWENIFGTRNVIIHIFDAPPHGDFPNYRSHNPQSNEGNCCCCNHGKLCPFDWEKDVWSIFCKFQVQYHGINTGRRLPQFENSMKSNLGELCGEFQTVGKEIVNDAIIQIFIDYKN